MVSYVVKKSLNNNVVIAVKDKYEFIIVGKGIGFNAKTGSHVPENKIENVFIKQSLGESKFDTVLNKVDSKIVGICEEIIFLCENELGKKLNEAIHTSLPDHIDFAFTRIKKGIKIENPFLNEIMVLYPKEYRLEEKALIMINENLSTKLPRDEIGFISMHINAAIERKNVNDTVEYMRKIGEVMKFISVILKKDIDKSSLSYERTVTHINFVLERIKQKKTIKNLLLDSIKEQLYNEYGLAIKVAIKLENLFSVSVPEDEIGYIAMHLKRLREL
ncbi:PRD domain-containing protein [Clostridium felsineum]|uniref:PRD domain-containing protein n=1 Tax=Clostridium felsineum TaxID=36839 RepID=UPI00098CE061|nr:PRD domain-containing protein [Clostridium felsineum]URZ01875.1 PtsGHI operon antiterminator [Clostridium felsineum]